MKNASTSNIEDFNTEKKGRDIRLLLVGLLTVIFAIVFILDLLGIIT